MLVGEWSELFLVQVWKLEPDTERCVSKDVGPQGRWMVKSHIDWRGGTKYFFYRGVET